MKHLMRYENYTSTERMDDILDKISQLQRQDYDFIEEKANELIKLDRKILTMEISEHLKNEI